MKKQLSIIIINFNVKFFLEHCLHSVSKALRHIDGEILVVDNASTDGSKQYFQNRFPHVRFFWNKDNIGFARANNQALQYANGRYIVFLNPDTLVPEDCFTKCIAFLQAHNNQAALGVRMIDGAGIFLKESKRSFPYPMTSLFKLTGLATLFPKSALFARYHLGHLDANKNHVVDVLAGAFMMMPAEVLEKVHGFDEDFFMYGEDIDLSYRIQKNGFDNYYFSDTSIIHFKGESTKKGSLNYVRMFYQAMSIFVNKHYKHTRAGVYNIMIQVAIALRGAVAALSRFVRWIGMPVIDLLLIAGSFWMVQYIWSEFVKQEVNYSPNILLIALPAFTGLFLFTSWLTGLYDGYYKQAQLNKSTLFAILVILACYALLPESVRFSRGILVFGSLMAFGLMSLVKQAFLRWGVMEKSPHSKHFTRTLIAGTPEEYLQVKELLQNNGYSMRFATRISPENLYRPRDKRYSLSDILKTEPAPDVILCEGTLSYSNIIELLPTIPPRTNVHFYSASLTSLIGSDDSNVAGQSFSRQVSAFNLNRSVSRRGKRMVDILVSVTFFLTAPVHVLLKKRTGQFFTNCWTVLSGKKTWVGYTNPVDETLPEIKAGILTTSGPDNSYETNELAKAVDIPYARDYEVKKDLELIWKNYSFLF